VSNLIIRDKAFGLIPFSGYLNFMQYPKSIDCFLFLSHWRRIVRQCWFLILVILTASLLMLISCVQQPSPSLLRVGVPQWIGFTHLLLAEELGYYKDTPIRLLDYPSGADLIQAFRNHEVEAMGTTIGNSMLLSETDPSLRVVLVADSSHGADVILSIPSIASLKDLAGHRVGLEASEVAAFVLNRALEQIGLSTDDVQIVLVSLSEQEAAFKQGKIDALVTYDPIRSHLLEYGAKQLFDSSQIPDEIVDVIIVHGDVLSHQPALIQTLVKSWFQAQHYFQQQPEEAANRMAPLQDLSPEQYLKSLEGIEFPSLEENQQLLSGDNSALVKGAKRLSEMMQRQNLLKVPVDPTNLINDQFVKNLKL
jgi:NitT/TauT family transport system substrate-binding protein